MFIIGSFIGIALILGGSISALVHLDKNKTYNETKEAIAIWFGIIMFLVCSLFI